MATPEIIKIAENTYSVKDGITTMYIVVGSERAVLIDTAFGSYDLKKLVKKVTKLPYIVINTHAHPDHIGGNKQFKEIYCHFNEFGDELRLGGKGEDIPWKLVGLSDGDILDLGGRRLEVVLIPGHSPGSICLLDIENRILFSGDSLQEGPVFMFVPLSDLDDLIMSLKKLKIMSDRFDLVYPAHNLAPVDASYIDELLDLCELVSSGRISPIETDLTIHDMPCDLYKKGRVSIYYKQQK